MSAPGAKAYIAVTAAYWAFMLTDGALRMLVLLHFHTLGFSPVELAYLFLLYEVMGIVTNLSAGWLAARFGLASTLYAGLTLQIIALLALSALDPGWQITNSVVFVMLVQGLSGVAKDLSKMSSKSAVKILVPEEGQLFRWVALLTGSKNAVKGVGFFIGAALLGTIGFTPAVFVMAALLSVILIAIVAFMPAGLPGGIKGTKASAILPKDPNILNLSLARVFLFGARDAWFVVGIPVFFYAVLSDGTPESARRAFFAIGTFMAAWILFYGLIQANASKLLAGSTTSLPDTVKANLRWIGFLTLIPAFLAAVLLLQPQPQSTGTIAIVVIGLLVFGAIFALNSALHSYLILAFAKSERVTMDVGFYYMANASGRLLGTFLSGASYQMGGVAACLIASTILCALSWFSARRLT
ncbi:MAG: organoarsenical effux MFS transporter ArsJ [Paracoccaceae bacterium]